MQGRKKDADEPSEGGNSLWVYALVAYESFVGKWVRCPLSN
jgi:hypothetical protein